MFLPMSWMSPLTVARMMVPLSPVPWGRRLRSTSKAAFTASAEAMSWGRNRVPRSYPSPTRSRAGMMQPLMTSKGSRSARRASTAAGTISFRPLMI